MSRACRRAAFVAFSYREYAEELFSEIIHNIYSQILARRLRKIDSCYARKPESSANYESSVSDAKRSTNGMISEGFQDYHLYDDGHTDMVSYYSLDKLVEVGYALAFTLLASTVAAHRADGRLALEWCATFERGGSRANVAYASTVTPHDIRPLRPRYSLLALLHPSPSVSLEELSAYAARRGWHGVEDLARSLIPIAPISGTVPGNHRMISLIHDCARRSGAAGELIAYVCVYRAATGGRPPEILSYGGKGFPTSINPPDIIKAVKWMQDNMLLGLGRPKERILHQLRPGTHIHIE